MEKSYFFIVNPYSNSGRTRKNWEKKFLPHIQNRFSKFHWAFTEKQGEAHTLAVQAKKENYHTVVAVGGDGTINEIVNGLMDNSCENNSTLGFLPAGTGCDFIKSLRLPRDLQSAFHVLEHGNTILSDVGIVKYTKGTEIKSCYFINIAGCGANGKIAERINQSKKIFGAAFSFWLAGVQSLFKDKCSKVLISFDDEPPLEVDLRVLFVCNGQFCGGGMKVGSGAQIDDGLFHINEMRKASLLKTLLLTPKLYSGDFRGVEQFVRTRTAKKIVVTSLDKKTVLVECDGEQPGVLPVEFSISEKKLSVCVPS